MLLLSNVILYLTSNNSLDNNSRIHVNLTAEDKLELCDDESATSAGQPSPRSTALARDKGAESSNNQAAPWLYFNNRRHPGGGRHCTCRP
jgi:hypothetical protein